MGRIFALGLLGTLASASLAFAQSGSIAGTITTTAKGAAPLRVTFDQKVCGDQLPDEAIVVDAQGRLANAVVVLAGVKRQHPTEASVVNEKCRFVPRVQLIGPKASVRTTSKDPILHTTNAQLENGRTLFNVAVPMPGITITKAIRASGNVRVICNTHPWMRGWIVATSDAAAISRADGRFSIDNVPAGTYDLRVWHEALQGAPQKVTVSAGKAAEVTFTLSP
ncbi:MAG TPA: carboxypeptidase regulatory-like domain-containing protein [Vicinamibacterales bacterium]|nr:carboxypeptidase regulatory-like domain-containing protein [Vicinamibacterales bacterium]